MTHSTQVGSHTSHHHPTITPWLTFVLAAACGLIVANLYYAQPLIGPISAELNLSKQAAGLIVTLTQIGYGLGLLLLVPLGDLFENRRLAITVMALGLIGLLLAALAQSALPFLFAALLIGFGSVTAQILVPYAAHLAPDATRGRVVGNVMSGLMLGIMLARPVASLITYFIDWRAVFYVSCVLMLLLALTLRMALPARPVHSRLRYGQMIASLGHLFLHTPTLRRRALYQFCMFGAFSMFWTAVPLLLAGPEFGLTQRGIAFFALAGVAGAIAAPLAGRVADRGWIRPGTILALCLAVAAFGLSHVGAHGTLLSLMALALSGIVLDFAVSGNLVLGQRVLFSLAPEFRSRFNGLFMAIFFCGGAIGSALSAWLYTHYGWNGVSLVAMAAPLMALVFFFIAED